MQIENNNSGMKKISFSTTIKATKEKIWDVLWNHGSYSVWTSAFAEGCYAESDWNEGSRILFLNGKGSGMYSTIEKKIPGEFMSFRHIGQVKEGKEQPLDEKIKAWSNGLENYTLADAEGSTVLTVDLDVPDDFMEYFTKTFPVALDNIKRLAETKTEIAVEAIIDAPVEKVWTYWSSPRHICRWCQASDDWHVPHAENDLQSGGKFLTRMEAKDGSFGFDFGGLYNEVKTNELIAYTLDDSRKVSVVFEDMGAKTKLTETFEPEDENSIELQQAGWQAILNNFKNYTEAN
jgi:uncharacterized protein YndB with AHSA1/START domain